MGSLVFGLDFDDTFTADPELWALFIREAQAKGHRVYCVTARRNSDENIEILSETFANHALEIPIVFCNLGSKTWTMEQRGIKVNIWIDDAPHALVHGH